MSTFEYFTPRDMYAAVFKHVREEHSSVMTADSPPRLIGVYCRQCEHTWAAPFSFDMSDWPADRPSQVEFASARETYLQHLVQVALSRPRDNTTVPTETATLWRRLLEDM